MKHNLKPILGEITALTINTPDLNVSLSFYKNLGFYELFRADWPFPWIQITDGVLLIMLRKDEKKYLALSYYVKNIERVALDLKEKGIIYTYEPRKGDPLKRYTFASPDNLNITLVGFVDGFAKPKGLGMLEMEQQDYFIPSQYTNKTMGMFGELAQPVANLESAVAFWSLLGFQVFSKSEGPYPWAILSDGLAVIGLHQTTQFTQPSITYFAADMGAKIQHLKQIGVTGFHDQDSNNSSLTTPEQQHILMYQFGQVDEQKKEDIFYSLRPLGFVKNVRPEIKDDFWGSVISEISLADNLPDEAFENITMFSHLEIIYYFDKVLVDQIVYSGKPRGIETYPTMGIFAQRKKDRPNKLGLCTVKLLEHKSRVIKVQGLDAIDGTPVLDIKPVFREFEPSEPIIQPEWVSSLMQKYWL